VGPPLSPWDSSAGHPAQGLRTATLQHMWQAHHFPVGLSRCTRAQGRRHRTRQASPHKAGVTAQGRRHRTRHTAVHKAHSGVVQEGVAGIWGGQEALN